MRLQQRILIFLAVLALPLLALTAGTPPATTAAHVPAIARGMPNPHPVHLAASVKPARTGAVFYDQGTPYGNYMNLWGGGPSVRDYNAVTYNDYIQVVGIGGGQFELVDEVNGGSDCIGDYGDTEGSARAGTGFCPTTGTAGWGTKFEVGPSCGNGFVKYYDEHWHSYVGIPGSDGGAVYLNTSGSCIKQMDPPATLTGVTWGAPVRGDFRLIA